MEKAQEHLPILKSNFTSFFIKNFFPRMNNKNCMKRGPHSYFCTKRVLIDFIAILLTPGIFLIQIVNTNMYLIHFYSKIKIKMHFPQSLVFKLQLHTSH